MSELTMKDLDKMQAMIDASTSIGVIYARYSCDRQTEQSIEGQLRVCEEYAQRNGIKIVDKYIDKAMTGTNDNRAAFQQMLSDAEKNVPWNVVLVYAIDRFGRDSIEIAVNKQRLKKNGKVLISATQRTSVNVDGTKNLDGILLENVYIGIAEYYSAELSQKVKRGMRESREKGQFTGGTLVFGYKVENKRIYVNEDEAKYVRYIFEQYASGVPAIEIHEQLTKENVIAYKKPICIKTMYNMLRNKKYCGIFECAGKTYTNIYPQIIPQGLYNKVAEMIQANKYNPHSKDIVYALKGKLVCGYCGNHLCAESGTSKQGNVKRYYKCMGRRKHICNKENLRKEEFEELIVTVTNELLKDSLQIREIAEEVYNKHRERMFDENIVNILENEMTNVENNIDNLVTAMENGAMTSAIINRLKELETKKQELETQIFIEKTKNECNITPDQIVEYLQRCLEQEPVAMIQMVIDKIIVYDDKIEIIYKYTNGPNTGDGDSDFSYIREITELNKILPLGNTLRSIKCVQKF